MANVLNVVTPTTVRIVWRSESLLLPSTEAIASAAEAPQIATAPADNIAKSRGSFSMRAMTVPIASVMMTPPTTIPAVSIPRLSTSPHVILAPSSATPNRRILLELKRIPGPVAGFSAR